MEAVGGAVPLEEIERQESHSNRWKFCGRDVPRSELVFFSQVILIYVVVCLCLFNLTTNRGDSNLWSALLSGCLGYLLPNPTIKR
jgi:hypothetical protein